MWPKGQASEVKKRESWPRYRQEKTGVSRRNDNTTRSAGKIKMGPTSRMCQTGHSTYEGGPEDPSEESVENSM